MKSSKKFFFWILGVSFVLLILSAIAPFIFTRPGPIDFSDTGQIGETINGLTSPFLTLIVALVTFAAFYVQYSANNAQVDRLEHQERANAKVIFENSLFSLINYHRQNVAEIAFEVYGHRPLAGQSSIDYITSLVGKVKAKLAGSIFNENLFTQDRMISVAAYLYIFYGPRLFSMEKFRAKYRPFLPQDVITRLKEIPPITDMYYLPEDGFGLLLSRYFRQLFQIVTFIATAEQFSASEKYYYAKTLRSNLSNSEQILLFYNSISPLGIPWISLGYLKDFKLIKNIPVELFSGYSPVQLFREEFKIDEASMSGFFESFE